MKNFCSFIAMLLMLIAISSLRSSAQCTPVGDPSVFGDHVWNVYAWNSGELSDQGTSWNTNYSGYYAETDMDLNTTLRWPSGTSPSTVPEYIGCPVNNDHHSWSAKRQGFTCNYYQINIPSHDDEAQLFINGVKVWEHDGCCDSHTNVWSGFLNDLSTLEYRATEGGGLSYGSIQFLTVTPSITGSSIICDGTASQLTAPAGDSYLWSTGETTQSISVSEAGTYSATITSASCSATTVPKSMSLHTPPSAPTTVVNGSNPYDACDGPSQLAVTNAGSYTYHWSNGMNGTVITPVGPGDFTATATDELGCVSDPSSPLTLDEIPAPGDPSVFGDQVWNVYAWNSTNWTDHYAGYLVNSDEAFYSWNLWSDHSTPSSNGSYQGCPVGYGFSWSAKRLGFDSGYYSFSSGLEQCVSELYVDGQLIWSQDYSWGSWSWTGVARACLGPNSTVELRIRPASQWSYAYLTFGKITNALPYYMPPSICPGFTETLYAESGDSYLWSTGDTTQSIGLTSSGTYSVTVYNGTCEVSGSYTLTVQPLEVPTTIVYGSNPYLACDAVPQLRVTNYSSWNSYHWNNGMSSDWMTPAGPGDYSVTATDWLGCVSEPSSPITLTQSQSPGDSTVFGDHQWNVYVHQDYSPELIGCYGYCNTPGTNYFYAGYLVDTNLNFHSLDHWTNSSPAYSTGYMGCYTASYNFHINAKRQGFDCGIYQINIPAHDDDAYVYVDDVLVWSETGAVDTMIANVWSGLLNEDSKIEFKVYQFFGDNFATIDVVPVQLFTPVTPTISGPTAVCGTTPITLNAGTGFSSYAWSTGSTTQTTSVSAAGNYSVKVTYANGCVATSQASITSATQYTYYRDADGDTYGNASVTTSACSQPALYVSNSTDCNDANGSINPAHAETCGNSLDDNCNGQTDEGCCNLSVNAGIDEDTYYGYTGDQAVTHVASVSGGTAPFTYSWTLLPYPQTTGVRALMCNNINGSGDETFSASGGTVTCTKTSCPSSGSNNWPGYPSAATAPVCSGVGANTISVTLVDSARVTVSVTDANGCVARDTFIVRAEDVRCWAGNNQKIKICHKTGNGCVTMCIDESAWAAHSGHGDFLGTCNKTCTGREDDDIVESINGSLFIYPNPASGNFVIELMLETNSNSVADVQVLNVFGQMIFVNHATLTNGELKQEVNLDRNIPSGNYFVKVILEDHVYTGQLVLQK